MPPCRLVFVVAFAELALFAMGPAARAEGFAGTVVVIQTRPVDLPGLGDKALRNTVEAAIKAQGGDVIRPQKLPMAETSCTTSNCFRALADGTGAAYVVRVDGSYASDGYDLYLEMWNAKSGALARGQSRKCQLCSTGEMLENARDQLTILCSQQLRAVPDAPAPPRPAAPEVVAAAAPVGPPAPRAPAASRLLPALAVGAGVGMLITGAYLWKVDGQPRDCEGTAAGRRCFSRQDTGKLGMSMLGAGAVAAGVGCAFLITAMRDKPDHLSVAWTANGVFIQGAF